MPRSKPIQPIDRLRSYSTAFSRKTFKEIVDFGDMAHLDRLYSISENPPGKCRTYADFLSYMYQCMVESYPCEYVFKNELINQWLMEKYGTEHTIAFNEFSVGGSIVDFAMMNGESKAFEIKTELDNPERLEKQMKDYRKLFNKCYLVISEDSLPVYLDRVDKEVGIILLEDSNHGGKLRVYREAKKNNQIDASLLLGCLRTKEYEGIVKTYFGKLPDVPPYEMYTECGKLLKEIPAKALNRLFIQEVKTRSSAVRKLARWPKELRQMALCLNLSERKQYNLLGFLNQNLKH